MGEHELDVPVRGIPMNFGDDRLPEAFWSHVFPCPVSGCWLWLGAVDKQGYGASILGRPHRAAFAASGGVLGDGRKVVIDHRCRVACCCNPVHLEQVSQRENVRRGRHGLLTDNCKNGHPFTAENRYVRSDGRSHCRACGRYSIKSTPAAEAWVSARKEGV